MVDISGEPRYGGFHAAFGHYYPADGALLVLRERVYHVESDDLDRARITKTTASDTLAMTSARRASARAPPPVVRLRSSPLTPCVCHAHRSAGHRPNTIAVHRLVTMVKPMTCASRVISFARAITRLAFATRSRFSLTLGGTYDDKVVIGSPRT